MSIFRRFMALPAASILLSALSAVAQADLVEYQIDIDHTPVNFTGQTVTAVTLNGGIPAPTIEASVGDTLRVTFHNRMAMESSIHWHGVLLPNDQDGVPYMTTQPIAANSSFTYEFPVVHSGTYWYHSHTGFQEQRGVYGAIVFHPGQELYPADMEQVLVLSDWTDEAPMDVLRNMKRDHDYYGIKKDSVQSWWRVLENGSTAVWNRLQANWTRMGAMDISDVGYDAFLVNGQLQFDLDTVMPGQKVRLRLINASGSSYFHVNFAGGPMEIVASDGVDVQPLRVSELMIATAETYDVIVSVPDHNRYELRATANDGTGYSSTWIGMHGQQITAVDYVPPNPYLMGHTDHAAMDHSSMDAGTDSAAVDHSSMDHSAAEMPVEPANQVPPAVDHAAMDHSMMDHSSMPMPMPMPMPADGTNMAAVDHAAMGHDMAAMAPTTDSTGVQSSLGHYQNLRAVESTAFASDLPLREVELRLTGSMDGYRWQFNDVPLSEADRILINRGEVVRFVLKNETMMSHPIHLHGHFFRVVTDAGDFSPLKHTVDVPSMQTVIIEFEANEERDWFFHCHNLYHMMTGMARVVRYSDFDGDASLPSTMGMVMSEDDQMWSYANLGAFSNFGEIMLWSFNDTHEYSAEIEHDWEDEVEIDAQYRYRLSRFLQLYGGIDYERDASSDETLAVAGIHYVLPGLIESEWRVDSEGNARLQLQSEIKLTSRMGLDIRWNTDHDWRAGLHYEVSKKFVIALINDSHYDFGAGVEYRF